MMWCRPLSLVLVCGLALSAAACGDDSTTPTAPTEFTTESYAGTIAPQETDTYTFTVKVSGQLTVMLNSVAPLATMAIGVSIGGWDGTTCTPVAINQNARAGTSSVLSGLANPGNFCLQVFDSGNMSDAVDYAIQVTHP